MGTFVNVQAFDLAPNDSSLAAKTANTAAIQAAIDYAYNNGKKEIKLAGGVFYCNPGIYLDAPGNLRTSLASPTISSFSLHLMGSGNDAQNNFGTELKFTDVTTTALIVGTGQQMRVSNLSLIGNTTPTSRA